MDFEMTTKNGTDEMSPSLKQIKESIYDPCGFKISNFKLEPEGLEYNACRFTLNGFYVISRNAKVTPKKTGQFVTFWKRSMHGPIAPFNENDELHFFIVNVKKGRRAGQFVFPKTVLIKKDIIATKRKNGKRAFRVYAPWDETKSKRAEQTKIWQIQYFCEINSTTDHNKIVELYRL